MATQTGYSICSICDIGCQVRTESEDGRVTRVIAHDNPMLAKNICFKVSQRRVFTMPQIVCACRASEVGERGENRWQEISYEQAMDEIAERPEESGRRVRTRGMAVSTSGWKHPNHASCRPTLYESVGRA